MLARIGHQRRAIDAGVVRATAAMLDVASYVDLTVHDLVVAIGVVRVAACDATVVVTIFIITSGRSVFDQASDTAAATIDGRRELVVTHTVAITGRGVCFIAAAIDLVTISVNTYRVDAVVLVVRAGKIVFFRRATAAMLDVIGDVDLTTCFAWIHIGITVTKAVIALDATHSTLTAVLTIGVRAVIFAAAAMVRVVGQVGLASGFIILTIDVTFCALINDARSDFAMGQLGMRGSARLIAATAVAGAAVGVGFTTILRQLVAIAAPHRAGQFTALFPAVIGYAAR